MQPGQCKQSIIYRRNQSISRMYFLDFLPQYLKTECTLRKLFVALLSISRFGVDVRLVLMAFRFCVNFISLFVCLKLVRLFKTYLYKGIIQFNNSFTTGHVKQIKSKFNQFRLRVRPICGLQHLSKIARYCISQCLEAKF